MIKYSTLPRLQYKLIVLLLLFTSITSLLPANTTSAANANDFNPGRIIDDGIFTNKNSMGWEQIQRFLNSKGVYCQNSQAPCLKNYTEGGKTAAQIIYDAGQEFNINPQVLVVLVQKEVGLVTATAPQNWQYRTAAGYGCPDSTPNVCNSSYYGFTNQIRWAGRMFKSIMVADPNWRTPYLVGTNSILWNPNTGCGRSTVVIQNRATQALYNYTPYRPNQAALNAGYGTGDGCSSYGNRNFFLYFNDWFGVSYRGPLWRTVNSGDLFYIEDGKKFIVPSMDIVTQFGMSPKDVSFVSPEELNAVPLASSPYSSTLGYVVKADNDPALYIVNGGYRTPIRSMDQFAQFGFIGSDIKVLPPSAIAKLTLSTRNLSNYIQKWDGSVYKVENGTKRTVFELGMISDGYTTPTPDAIIDRLTFARAYTSNDNFVVYGADSGVRLYTPSGYHEIASMDVFSCWNLSSLPGYRVSSYETVPHTKKDTLFNCVARFDSQSQWYLMNGGTKVSLDQGRNTVGTTSTSSLIAGSQTISVGPVIKSYWQNEIAVLSDNKKRAIPSMKAFSDLGYTSNSVSVLNNAAYNTLSYGARALSRGMTLLEPGGGISVVTSPTSRLQIISVDQYDHFGLNWGTLVRVDDADLLQYPSTGDLEYVVKADNDEVYLIDKGVRYLIPSAIDPALGINRNTLPSLPNKVFFETTLPWILTPFIKSNNDNAIYKLENGTKRPLASWDVFMRESNNRPQDIVVLSPAAVARYQTGPTKN